MKLSNTARSNILYGVSFVLAILGQKFLFFDHNKITGSIFFAAAAVIIIFACQRESSDENKYGVATPLEVTLFLIILFAAVFMRFFHLSELPPGLHYDEAQNGLNALSIMNDEGGLPVYYSDATHNPAAFIYIIAAAFRFFGVNPVVLRAVPAVIGVLSVAALYFLARRLYGVKAALFSMFVFAFMRWHVNFSRIAFHASFSVLVFLIFLYFFMKALKGRKIADFILSGALLALTQYTYQPARLLPLAVIISAVYIELRYGGFIKPNLKKMILFAAAFAVVIAPLGIFAAAHFGEFTERAKEVNILNKDARSYWLGRDVPVWDALLSNLKSTLFMFNSRGDNNPRHNLTGYPMMDFMTGMLAFLGICAAIRNKDKGRSVVLLIFLFAMILPGVLTIEAPQALRTVLSAPLFAVFAGLFFKRIYDHGSFNGAVLAAAIAAICCFIAYSNFNVYFNRQFAGKDTPGAFCVDQRTAGKFAAGLDASTECRVHDWFYEASPFKFIATAGKEKLMSFDPALQLPLPETRSRFVELIMPQIYATMEDTLRYYYPGIIKEKGLPGGEYFTAYRIQAEEINTCGIIPGKNGLTAEYFSDDSWSVPSGVKIVEPFIFNVYGKTPCKPPYSIEWKGKVRIKERGRYTFSIVANSHMELFLDNRQVLQIEDMSQGRDTGLEMTEGMHPVRVRARVNSYYPEIYLFWKKPSDREFSAVPVYALWPEKGL